MKRLTASALAGAMAVVGCVGAVVIAAPVAAIDGACPTSDGVTVIVDASAIGGTVSQRCAPDRPTSGLDALRRAGFSWSPVSSQPAMVCRIDSRPAPSAQSCSSSPPANAYWGYFRANRGGDWKYSSVGAASAPISGGVEGWVFLTGGQRPPGIKPPAVLQRTESVPAKTATPTSAPKSKPSSTTGSKSAATPSVTSSTVGAAQVPTVPVPPPTATAATSGNPPVAAGETTDAAATDVADSQDLDPAAAGGGSALSTVFGLVIVGGLVVAAVVMGVRRKRSS